MLVIGAGQAGPPLAIALAKKRWRVALAERKLLGGSCVNFGCTPTKAVIASARVAWLARRAREFGIRIPSVDPDLGAVLERARGIVTQSRAGLRKAIAGEKNLTFLPGHARFEARDRDGFRVRVGTDEVRAKQVVIDTGTRSRIPAVAGLDTVDFLTAENWIDRPELPRHLVILGAGYTGLEMAQFYRRMGSRVTVVDRGAEIAGREDADVSQAIRTLLESEDVAFRLETTVARAEAAGGGVRLSLRGRGGRDSLAASHVFVATGRRPNTDDLGLEAIGLRSAPDGTIEVNKRLATRVRGVWAAGDVRGGPMFTHTAWDDYRVLLSQLAGDRSRTTDRIVPYAIYTDPQLGRVGMTEFEARESGRRVRIGRFELRNNGKAKEIGETEGFVKVVVDARSDRILGAAVLASEGAELVHLFVAIMNARAKSAVIRDAIHVHPTLAEAVQSAVAALA
ncbi:MAG: mercuric reductase [Acidobacteriota bacterium]|nr:mercuric reductase [Acidobacteriota bacterium]MDQ5872547.1 mercuric reductase [Acidobacteriota bacterium]